MWEALAMAPALARHDVILQQIITASGGIVFKTVGDAVHAVFTTAPDALDAAIAAQHALHHEPWGVTGPLRVRMAIHTGAADMRDGDYFGPSLNRIARMLGTGHGGQILLSHATAELVRDRLPPGASLIDLGAHQLKDLSRPEQIFQLVSPDLPSDFPPLTTLAAGRVPAAAFPSNLLATKLFVPPARANLVVRPRLFERVEAGLRDKLTLIAAPAGFGKTTLLSAWRATVAGSALFRARILPRWAAGLLACPGPLAIIMVALLPHQFERLAAMPMGFAQAWLGYALWSERREHAAEAVPGRASRQLGHTGAEQSPDARCLMFEISIKHHARKQVPFRESLSSRETALRLHPSKELNMNANIVDHGTASEMPQRSELGTPMPQKPKAPIKARSAKWLVTALLLLCAFPLVAGAFRLTQLAGGAEITPANARFFASPILVVVHIVGAGVYAVLGAFQFAKGFRRRRPGRHRVAGRLVVVCGLLVGLSALWMTLFYPWPKGDGALLYVLRLLFGSAMVGSIVLGFTTIRHGDVNGHRAWMTRGYAIGLGAATQMLTLVVE